MRDFERTQLMHVVLDGAATPDEALELERVLGADPAARTEFENLKSLFEGLSRVPKAFPPEGLVAAVMASVPRRPVPQDHSSQLYSESGVFRQSSMEARGANPGKSAKVQQVSQPGPYLKGQNVSEQKNGFFSKRKVWIGGGIAAAAAVLAVSFGIDFPPGVKDTIGTIVPAVRFRAPQNTADDVKLGNPSSQSAQTNPAGATGQGNAGAGPSGAGPSGVGASGTGPSGVGPSGAGPSGVGPSGAGPSGAGPSGAGPSGAGPSGAGPSGVGPSGAGPSGVGPSGAGPSGVGPSGAGPSGVGPSGAGPSGVGPSGVGPSGVGPSGVGPSGVGPSGVGPSGVGPSGVGPSGVQQ
jgi:hypothetical protein